MKKNSTLRLLNHQTDPKSIMSLLTAVSLWALWAVDNLFRLKHYLVTAPLVYLGLLPSPVLIVPSKKKYVLITGASTGIGRDAALQLSHAGFSVFAGVRKQADAESVRADGLLPLIIDVAKDSSVEKALEEVKKVLAEEEGRQLVAVVANAGVGNKPEPIEDAPLADIKALFEVNVFGAVRTVQAFLPFIRASRGRVVLMSSVAGFTSTPGLGPYCMSKHALEALTASLRREVGPLGVSVSVVQPGPVDTPILDKFDLTPPSHETPYPHVVSYVADQFPRMQALAAPVSVTSDAVLHAVTAAFPAYRYRVTWAAYLLAEIITKLPAQLEEVIYHAQLRSTVKAKKN